MVIEPYGSPVLAPPGSGVVYIDVHNLLGILSFGKDRDGKPGPAFLGANPIPVDPSKGATLHELNVVHDDKGIALGHLVEEAEIGEIIRLVSGYYHDSENTSPTFLAMCSTCSGWSDG